MKILLLGTNITTGGAQRVLLDLAGWLHQRSIPVSAAFLYDRDGLLEVWQARYPFPIHCFHAWRLKDNPLMRFLRMLCRWLGMARWMRKERFTSILTFTHDSNILGLSAAWLAGVPSRYGSHHNRYPTLSPFRTRLHKFIINRHIASGIVAVSSFTRQQAIEEGIHPDRITIIHNGIDTGSLTPTDPQTVRQTLLSGGPGPLVLAVGRLVEQKGHAYFIHAAASLKADFPQAQFCIAGGGELHAELQSLVESMEAQASIRLLGMRGDVPDLLAAADLFVMASLYEGLPMALLEAMAAGTPAVSTDIPGVSDVVQDGESGLLVPPEDPAALAGAIRRMLQDPALRQRLADAGQARVAQLFTLDRMGQAYFDLLEPPHHAG